MCRRPRQIYVGEGEREYVDIEKRSDTASSDPTKVPSQVPHLHSKRVFLARDSKM